MPNPPCDLPHCRHRRAQVTPEHWICASTAVHVLGGLVTREICAELCPFVDRANAVTAPGVERARLPATVADSGEPEADRLSIAMITAPRAVHTLDRSLAELRLAGFGQVVQLFAEPGSPPPADRRVMWRPNPRRLGAWRNWLHASRTLLETTAAPFLLICEDDIALARCAAAALQHAMHTLPLKSWGAVSLYTPRYNLPARPPVEGWCPARSDVPLWGALALCFSRHSLAMVLTSPTVIDHPGNEDADIVVSAALERHGLISYCHVPSLCDHTGRDISTLNHSEAKASAVVGFSAAYARYGSPASAADEPRVLRGRRSAADAVGSAADQRVCVIVPTYNCAPWLPAAISSLQRQTVPAEIVVVDDGSTDQTAGVLAALNHVQVYRHPERRGANAARATGLRMTRSTWVVFADADAIYHPRFLEQLLQCTGGGASVAYSAWQRKCCTSQAETLVRTTPFEASGLWWNNFISMCSLVRRDHLPRCSGEQLSDSDLLDDWALWLAMAAEGRQFAHTDACLFTAFERPEGKTSFLRQNGDLYLREVARLRRRFSKLSGLDAPLAVAIPATDCADLTQECLWHLAQYSGLPLQIYYVDNGSQAGVADSVASRAAELGLEITVLRNRRNEQFTYAINQAIAASGTTDLLCLNNDCFVGPECLERLSWHLRSEPGVAAVGPLTGDGEGQSLRHRIRRQQAQVVHPPADYNDPLLGFLSLQRARRAQPLEMLAFFCTLLSGRALRRVGPLNPAAVFSAGLGADDDWCRRARRAGWSLKLALDAYAAHLGSQSFRRLGTDRAHLQRQAMRALQRTGI